MPVGPVPSHWASASAANLGMHCDRCDGCLVRLRLVRAVEYDRHPNMRTILISLCAGLAGSVYGATVLFDFEKPADLTAWKWASQSQSQLALAPQFATTGKSALRFTTPTWKQGMPEWPSFETKPPITDWSDYDRLVVDLTNPNAEPYFLSLFVSDSKVPFRQGLSYRFAVPSRGFRRFEIPFSAFPKTVNRADIAIIHLFTERPKTDLSLFLDNLVLLRPGKSLPEPGSEFAQQLAKLTTASLSDREQQIAATVQSAQAFGLPGDLRESAVNQLAPIVARLKAFHTKLSARPLTLAQLEWDPPRAGCFAGRG